MEALIQYPSESGHWYAPDGSPRYTVLSKAGTPRPTTLRDARKHGWYPSVTTVLQTIAKPGLERWKAEQVLLSALTLPPLAGESEKAWVGRVWQDSREQARAAADKGTEIHGAIEKSLRGRIVHADMQPYVNAFRLAVEKLDLSVIVSEKSFASSMGYGGKIDILTPNVLLDVKTKDGDIEDAKLWPEHYMQLGAYAAGTGFDGACGIVFVSRTVAGTAVLKMAHPAEIIRGFEMFKALLAYWQTANGHYPA